MREWKVIRTVNGSTAVDAMSWLESRQLLGVGETEDSEGEIQDHYRTLVAPLTYRSKAGFQGQNQLDCDAFEECARDYGYVPAIKALRGISEKATKRDAAHRAKRARP